MAIFKPEVSNKEYTSFTGVCEFGIIGFKDRSGEFDWADLFLEVTVRQKDSDYDRTLQIKGSFDKEGGKITGGSALKKMYHFFEQIGCEAGLNVDGGWEDAEGNKIDDIAAYLNEHHVKASSTGADYPDLDYIGYFYKEQPKVPGGKSYIRVLARIYRNTASNIDKLKADVDWMKSKGYLKELTGDSVAPTTNQMSGNALGNL